MAHPPVDPPPPERRRFLKFVTVALGTLWAAFLGTVGALFFIDGRNRTGRNGAFRTVARLADLPEEVPYQVVIRDRRRDAWTLHPNDLIGRVWLVRRKGDKVDAYTTVCPHLGCSINFEPAAGRFICPCHNGCWDLQARRITDAAELSRLGLTKNPSPRDMDSLEVRRDPTDPEMIQVDYRNFVVGIEEKKLQG
jgi:Rieske Fe-S protein